jgi:hypothetical protein
MRRPLRNIEIFSMSVLDMFASALGAFIIIAVILFPYYNNQKRFEKTTEDLKKTAKKLQEVNLEIRRFEERSALQQQELQEAKQAQTALAQCKQSEATCRTENKSFLVVGIEWEAPCDVDLHVTDPLGNEFKFDVNNRNGTDFHNSPAALSLDMNSGPGIEIWQNPDAPPGDYRIGYQLFRIDFSAAVVVKGWVIDRSAGRRELPDKALDSSHKKETVAVATVRVNSDGSSTIIPARN